MSKKGFPQAWDTNPGSPEAIARGCTCPVLDNGHGRGFPYAGEIRFWINWDCPLHGGQTKEEPAP